MASGIITPPTGGQVCALLAVDIVEFTRADRDDVTRIHLHGVLYRILEEAFDASEIPWSACSVEDRGDGALIIIPPSFSARAAIDPLPERLRTLIRHHNHVSSYEARIQLREAVHTGPVDHDGHGFIGSDVDFLFRMLDARSFRAVLTGSDADLACIVSEDIYRNIVCRFPNLVSPHDFRQIRFQVKRTKGKALIYVPGRSRWLTPKKRWERASPRNTVGGLVAVVAVLAGVADEVAGHGYGGNGSPIIDWPSGNDANELFTPVVSASS